MLIPFYLEFSVFGPNYGLKQTLAHDVIVQRWEAAVFASQISYQWIRRYPSVLWSGVLHLAYLWYYFGISLGPILLVARGRREGARAVIFPMMVAYVACYLVFLFFPVAGPYYAFPHPEGPVRQVWSAQLVYGLLVGGSSFGAAFPSSHVAAT